MLRIMILTINFNLIRIKDISIINKTSNDTTSNNKSMNNNRKYDL